MTTGQALPGTPTAYSAGETGPEHTRRRGLLVRYLSRFDDGEVVRWAFRGLLLGAIGVLALDLLDLSKTNGWVTPGASLPSASETVLPPAVSTDAPAPANNPIPFLTADEAKLRQPMSFNLGSGGVLLAEGSIDPGTALRFAAEIETRGEYVKTVSLNSPGGALDEAIAMARLARKLGLATEVADGALCASSCPLFLAGGTTRRAGERAAIGVHQFYAATTGSATGPEQAMADAQSTTARISRHLAEMEVDPAMWLHALDTPPRSLYYLSRDEMIRYRLVTDTLVGAAG